MKLYLVLTLDSNLFNWCYCKEMLVILFEIVFSINFKPELVQLSCIWLRVWWTLRLNSFDYSFTILSNAFFRNLIQSSFIECLKLPKAKLNKLSKQTFRNTLLLNWVLTEILFKVNWILWSILFVTICGILHKFENLHILCAHFMCKLLKKFCLYVVQQLQMNCRLTWN